MSLVAETTSAADLHYLRKEWASGVTHAVGFALSLVGAALLWSAVARTGDTARIVGCGIFAGALVAVYFASSMSHLVHEPRRRSMFRTLDQAFIYLLIVGSYTPLAVAYLHSGKLGLLLGAMWVVAVGGFLSKIVWRHRVEGVSLVAYIVLGWLPVMGIGSAWELLPTPAFFLFVVGGVVYTLGIPFLVWDHKGPLMHAVWHVFVMAGSSCHYCAIFSYVAVG